MQYLQKIENRDRQLRKDAKRIGMKVKIKAMDSLYYGYTLYKGDTVMLGGDPVENSAGLVECENFVRAYAQMIGAMSDDGRWLVDANGEPLEV